MTPKNLLSCLAAFALAALALATAACHSHKSASTLKSDSITIKTSSLTKYAACTDQALFESPSVRLYGITVETPQPDAGAATSPPKTRSPTIRIDSAAISAEKASASRHTEAGESEKIQANESISKASSQDKQSQARPGPNSMVIALSVVAIIILITRKRTQ